MRSIYIWKGHPGEGILLDNYCFTLRRTQRISKEVFLAYGGNRDAFTVELTDTYDGKGKLNTIYHLFDKIDVNGNIRYYVRVSKETYIIGGAKEAFDCFAMFRRDIVNKYTLKKDI